MENTHFSPLCHSSRIHFICAICIDTSTGIKPKEIILLYLLLDKGINSFISSVCYEQITLIGEKGGGDRGERYTPTGKPSYTSSSPSSSTKSKLDFFAACGMASSWVGGYRRPINHTPITLSDNCITGPSLYHMAQDCLLEFTDLFEP